MVRGPPWDRLVSSYVDWSWPSAGRAILGSIPGRYRDNRQRIYTHKCPVIIHISAAEMGGCRYCSTCVSPLARGVTGPMHLRLTMYVCVFAHAVTKPCCSALTGVLVVVAARV